MSEPTSPTPPPAPTPPPTPPAPALLPSSPERLSLRWALILLASVVAGLLAGLLTYAQSGDWPGSLMAAFGASGATLLGLPLLV
ncbi:hypothetical protein AB0G87_13270 [Streptomyces asoensis]|uniref:hypothetical protein n=1 Tax=Streptomyces asoensis TaxID=249586 RepID=UPI0033DFAA60